MRREWIKEAARRNFEEFLSDRLMVATTVIGLVFLIVVKSLNIAIDRRYPLVIDNLDVISPLITFWFVVCVTFAVMTLIDVMKVK